jgi:hypothetical protein
MPNFKEISETLGEKHCVFASFVFEQGVGGDSGAQIDMLDVFCGYLLLLIFDDSFADEIFPDADDWSLSFFTLGYDFEDSLPDDSGSLDILDIEICEGASSIDIESITLMFLFLLHL